MQYVGMDVYWRQTAICILDENGRRVNMINVRGAWPKGLRVRTTFRPLGGVF